jgi:hypothetical protein
LLCDYQEAAWWEALRYQLISHWERHSQLLKELLHQLENLGPSGRQAKCESAFRNWKYTFSVNFQAFGQTRMLNRNEKTVKIVQNFKRPTYPWN